ncbi:MAG TPA: peptide ABC transporter substrate-binding protein, partial [Pyrinomonadaceae bacterium]|nr:peptide ABC transporter substrate-binding protein [Pyrinomonadaceae bacterium]
CDMKLKRDRFQKGDALKFWVAGATSLILMLTSGCWLDSPVEPFYGKVVVPHAQEFNWSNGGLPRTFDPAFAAAPPDTDLVRAIFEGLTDYDPKTLAPVPGVATRWEASNGGRTWTFHLRKDAQWSNGEPVTAQDFVRSWRRIVRIGDLAPHTNLLENIEGSERRSVARPLAPAEKPTEARFGVEALSDSVLRVRLRRPDMNFPALVAHPVFRPVKVSEEVTTSKLPPENIISNGAFSLAKNEAQRVLLERAPNYWDKQQVTLERVAFVHQKDAESALAAYEAGTVDVVTNVAFEPLALKLLAPYEDFRRTTYGALTYYTFNTSRQPFDDVRVREALALALDRERISNDDLAGATEPATRFLPETVGGSQQPVVEKSELLEKDHERARELIAEAGFPDGEGFPTIRLLINRNEQQRIVAQSVAGMWWDVLGVETEIVIKPWDEYERAITEGDFDVVRRGLVMQTTDELTNIRSLFQEVVAPRPEAAAPEANADESNHSATVKPAAQPVETEAQALKDLAAMPIYFASSYALVKPYVTGFDSNVLDAPSLKTVRINTAWKPSPPAK